MKEKINTLLKHAEDIWRKLDKNEIQAKIEKYEKEINQKNFWNDPKRAQEVIKAQSILKNKIDPWEELINKIKDLSDLCEIAENEKDTNGLEIEFNTLEKQYKDLLTISYFKEELDANNAFLTIHSGAGGTEACDWVAMLYRMYSRYAERKKYKTELIDLLEAEGGIKSVTIEIKGEYAYGLLKSEVGIHRLIRISPFDAAKKRHTSFASVFVDPVIDDKIEIIIKPEDIRIDTYRASGAGGQHVNKTSSAVRITHIETGIVTQSQSDRSQHKNKDLAMKVLKSRLYEYYKSKEDEKNKSKQDTKKEISWGNQIRSYVFQPYNLVKDHRTKFENSNTTSVMDGNIDNFIEEYLKWKSLN
ncbi:peptide chain release factor 2 [Borreliella burgdorferi]|uniref:peptide chain release factor 2 n=1 Tax=Borreliella burgdorferi TaxID=139 RepID=UPI000D03618A|nr:peptide chain release factor 2 [Borreliella burgdorferi]MCD2322211.1 peptide chain release factor 2 [Borreliella burgdorferi]MCD2374302.1 peptide chain release factor 2 [Borreliella burgdorferi]MCD2383753.1 peptide chain release factor 2 [Borreliella burgdorferi]MCD2384625.1 peptide chain release factor 2 [Borreliella burgdorferi]MCD2389937.1 peptide chain release factor 2 [Borreliella burgdorferi]